MGSAGGQGFVCNQSSRVSGRLLIYACKGILERISNASGHAEPSAENLLGCINGLDCSGANLDHFGVKDKPNRDRAGAPLMLL